MKKERRTVKNNQLYIVTQTAQDVSERERERKEKKKERREKGKEEREEREGELWMSVALFSHHDIVCGRNKCLHT